MEGGVPFSRLVRNPFSSSEDLHLKKAVKKYGRNWAKVSSIVKSRSPRQCKERWETYLDPNISLSEWTEEEDKRIIECVERSGNIWKAFVSYFPGRTATSIKNRYRLLERHKAKKEKLVKVPINKIDDSKKSEMLGPLTSDISNEHGTEAANFYQIDISSFAASLFDESPADFFCDTENIL